MAAYGYGSKLRCQTGNFWKVGTTWSICNLQPLWGLAQKFTSSGLKCLTWLVDRMHVCRSLCLWRMLALEAANGFCVRLWWWLCRMARPSLMPSNHQITYVKTLAVAASDNMCMHFTNHPWSSWVHLQSVIWQRLDCDFPRKSGAFLEWSDRCVSITGSTWSRRWKRWAPRVVILLSCWRIGWMWEF